jgi:hypothetical protein
MKTIQTKPRNKKIYFGNGRFWIYESEAKTIIPFVYFDKKTLIEQELKAYFGK